MLVRELLIRLGFTTDTNGADAVDKKVNDIRGSADRAASSLFEMAGAFALFAGAVQITKVADEMQSLEARIGMLAQTATDSGTAFEEVSKRASAARQSIEAYGGFYVKAGEATKNFIKTQEELFQIVDGAALGLAASGATAVEQSQAFFQLGQAIGSPVVQMEEMNTLIDAAPQLFKALGREIAGTEDNFKKIIGTGKVTGKMLAEGLTKVAEEFRVRMLKMPIGMDTAMVLVRNKWKTFVQRMNRESMAITTMAKAFLEAFDQIEVGLEWVIDKLGGGSNAMRVMAIVLGTILLPVILSATASLWAMIAPVLPLIIAMVLLGLAVEDLYVWVKGGDSAMGRMFGKFENYTGLIDDMKKSFVGLKDILSGVLDTLAYTLKLLWAMKTMDFTQMKEAFGELAIGIPKITGGITAISEVAGANVNRVFGDVSPRGMSTNSPSYAAGNTYNVNVAVPAGTPQQQAAEVQRQLSQPATEQKLSRYLTGG